MAENRNKRPYISFKTDLGIKRFHSIESLQQWIEEQENCWKDIFNKKNTPAVRNIFQGWSQLQQEILSSIENSSTKNELKEAIKTITERKFEKKEIISSENQIATEIKELSHNNEAEGFLDGYKNHVAQNIKNDHLRLSGYIKGQIFRSREWQSDRLADGKIKKLIDDWSEKNEALVSSLYQSQSEHDNLLNALTTTQSEALERVELAKDGFNAALNGVRDNYQKFLKNADSSIDSIRETYRKHMSLRASVDYWSAQASEHDEKAKNSFTCLISFTIATIALFLCLGIAVLVTATPEDLKGSALSLSYGHAVKGLIAALLLSFMIWAIKLSNKTWHIHKHLHQDAKERVTMMKTYLALVSEEKNLKDNDVELILSSLFRPAYDGIIKDETAPRSLLDFVMKDGR